MDRGAVLGKVVGEVQIKAYTVIFQTRRFVFEAIDTLDAHDRTAEKIGEVHACRAQIQKQVQITCDPWMWGGLLKKRLNR